MDYNVFSGYRNRKIRYKVSIFAFIFILLILSLIGICYGNRFYSPDIVFRALLGEEVKGASFTIMTLRLPRVLAGIFCGFAFAMAGNTFQKLLGNSLASPDIIGVTAGSSVAAVFGILFLGLSKDIVSLMAMASGMGVATIIYLLAINNGYSNGRLILIGIGVQAFLRAIISWMLLNASAYDVGSALRWLSGSLNGVSIDDIPRLIFVVIVSSVILLILRKHLDILQLGNEYSITMGINVNKCRIYIIICSIFLISFATSVSGPISSVAFLSGPIASRICGRGESNIISSALVGAILVMSADLVGQYAFFVRYPVGVITGILGAPYLIFLLIRYNKKGA